VNAWVRDDASEQDDDWSVDAYLASLTEQVRLVRSVAILLVVLGLILLASWVAPVNVGGM
jgi:hypothetical protein